MPFSYSKKPTQTRISANQRKSPGQKPRTGPIQPGSVSKNRPATRQTALQTRQIQSSHTHTSQRFQTHNRPPAKTAPPNQRPASFRASRPRPKAPTEPDSQSPKNTTKTLTNG